MNTKQKYLATVLAAMVLLSGCALARHRSYVRDGLLVRGLHRDAFLEEWGHPTRTSTITGEEAIQAGWSNTGGSFFKGRAVYDVWDYEKPNIVLIFSRARLVTWKTELTVNQLREQQ